MSFQAPRFGARLALVTACAFAVALQAVAATAETSAKPAVKTAAKKTPLLTREELRVCMSNQTKLHQQRDELSQLQARLTSEKADIVRTGNELKDQLASLDRGNQEAVDKYAEATAAREKRIDAFELSSNDYNAKVQSLETADAAYKKDCADRRFDEKDEIAIRKGK